MRSTSGSRSLADFLSVQSRLRRTFLRRRYYKHASFPPAVKQCNDSTCIECELTRDSVAFRCDNVARLLWRRNSGMDSMVDHLSDESFEMGCFRRLFDRRGTERRMNQFFEHRFQSSKERCVMATSVSAEFGWSASECSWPLVRLETTRLGVSWASQPLTQH
jgi:hypothetical protein